MEVSMDKEDLTIGPAVEASTDVVLTDGSSINVKIIVVFKTVAQPVSNIQNVVTAWFNDDGFTQNVTLERFINDSNYVARLSSSLRTLPDAVSASLLGFSVLTPPVKGFAEKSKKVIAILASGETVKLTFGVTWGIAPAPGAVEINAVYELLSSLKFSQLSVIQKLLNDKLRPVGWVYLVLGLEQLSCPCNHG
jgi:hypothetical protein